MRIGPLEIRWLSPRQRLLEQFKSVGPSENRHSPMKTLGEMMHFAYEKGYQEKDHTFDEVNNYLLKLINRPCPNSRCKACNPGE
jgi:hypothetical protein